MGDGKNGGRESELGVAGGGQTLGRRVTAIEISKAVVFVSRNFIAAVLPPSGQIFSGPISR